MPTRKINTTEIVSKTAVAPKAAAPIVSNVAKSRGKTAVSTHKARTTSAAPVEITTQQIADLAYFIWMDQGCPEGMSEANWLKAESTLLAKTAGA